jgi:hypothetical protein
MTENEAIEKIKYRMHTAEHVAGECGMEDLEMAIKALEEVQRWHTSEINPNIKNEFANTSTQICHNCDHKDEYIEELEAEVEEYRTIGTPEELQEMKKDFAEALSDWRQYRKIGTLEECRAAVEKQTDEKPTAVLGTFGGTDYECKNCGSDVRYGDEYCRWCGWKLDWSDEE